MCLGHHEPYLLTSLSVPVFRGKYSISHCICAQQIHWRHCEVFLFIFLNFSFVPEFSCPITVHVNHMFQFIGDMKEDYLSLIPFSACCGVCFGFLI